MRVAARWSLVVLVAVVLGGCGWRQVGFDAGRTRFNPGATRVGPTTPLTVAWATNVSGSAEARSTLVAGGRVFAGRGGGLTAFDLGSGTELWHKNPPVTVPQGQATTTPVAVVPGPDGADLVIAAGAASSTAPAAADGALVAYDAVTGTRAWIASLGRVNGAVVVGDRVLATFDRGGGGLAPFRALVAFDAGTGVERFRVPGLVSVGAAGATYVFAHDTGTSSPVVAVPIAGCGSAQCAVAWRARPVADGGFPGGATTVADGHLVVSTTNGVFDFPSGGCGAVECLPTWHAVGIVDGVPAVAHARVFVTSATGGGLYRLEVFDLAGCGAAVCTPLWRGDEEVVVGSGAPVVAGGGVTVAGPDAEVRTWPESGCGGVRCAAVRSLATNAANGSAEVVVADDRLIVNGNRLAVFAPA